MEEKKAAGRRKKPENQKKKKRPVYATDAEWSEIERKAEADNSEVSPYVIKKALS